MLAIPGSRILASLLIRNVDAALHERLKARATAHRRSLEEEARELLRSAVARPPPPKPDLNLADLALTLFGPERGVPLEIPPRDPAQDRPPPDFSGADHER
jgi:antitoxin FitA